MRKGLLFREETLLRLVDLFSFEVIVSVEAAHSTSYEKGSHEDN